jgi:hypothetical protein
MTKQSTMDQFRDAVEWVKGEGAPDVFDCVTYIARLSQAPPAVYATLDASAARFDNVDGTIVPSLKVLLHFALGKGLPAIHTQVFNRDAVIEVLKAASKGGVPSSAALHRAWNTSAALRVQGLVGYGSVEDADALKRGVAARVLREPEAWRMSLQDAYVRVLTATGRALAYMTCHTCMAALQPHLPYHELWGKMIRETYRACIVPASDDNGTLDPADWAAFVTVLTATRTAWVHRMREWAESDVTLQAGRRGFRAMWPTGRIGLVHSAVARTTDAAIEGDDRLSRRRKTALQNRLRLLMAQESDAEAGYAAAEGGADVGAPDGPGREYYYRSPLIRFIVGAPTYVPADVTPTADALAEFTEDPDLWSEAEQKSAVEWLLGSIAIDKAVVGQDAAWDSGWNVAVQAVKDGLPGDALNVDLKLTFSEQVTRARNALFQTMGRVCVEGVRIGQVFSSEDALRVAVEQLARRYRLPPRCLGMVRFVVDTIVRGKL